MPQIDDTGDVAEIRAISNRGLRRVLGAYFTFNAVEIATWVAILLYAYEAIGPTSVGVVALVQLVPAAVVAPPAAMLGDRFPRHRVLSGGYLIQASAMLLTGCAMLLGAPPWAVVLAGTASASSLVVTRPTQNALMPSLARTPEELTAANGAAGAAEGLGLLVGPLTAAAILTTWTPGAVFIVAAFCMVLAAAVTLGLRPEHGLSAVMTRAEDKETRDDAGFLAGLRTVARDPDGRLIVGLLTARMVMIGAADVIFVLMAFGLLGSGQPGVGVLSAALGAGTIAGGALTIAFAGRGRFAVLALGGALAWSVGLVAAAISGSPILAPVLILVGAAGMSVLDIAGRTILQRAVRDEVLARVFGLQEGLSMAAQALGSILVPVVVALATLVPSIVVIAAVLPVLVLLAWGRLVELDRRSAAPLRELELLRLSPLFRPLPAPQLEAVARRAVWMSIPDGTTIIAEGEPGDRFYVIASGSVRVDRGGELLRELSQPGEGFGEIALLRDVPRTATVTATSPTTLLAVDRAPFLAAVTGHPAAFAAAQGGVDRARM